MAIVELHTIAIERPEGLNVIVGHAHFVKTVEDIHEALVGTSPYLRFGLAFCEASGPCLVRRSGNDDELIVAETELGRGVVGVVDGFVPAGVETGDDVADRKRLLREIGYKL